MKKIKKGDMFIIEIAERHTHYTDDGKPFNLYRIKGMNTCVFDDYGLAKLKRFIPTKETELSNCDAFDCVDNLNGLCTRKQNNIGAYAECNDYEMEKTHDSED